MGKVIVDTDFLNHFIKSPNGENVLNSIVEFFDFDLVMHPWVYDREIKNIFTPVQQYVDKHIQVYEYNTFIKDDDDEYLYAVTFKSLYEAMNNKPIPIDPLHFRTYKHSGENLGEIHSIILSMLMEIPILLSDDHKAKEVAVKRINRDGYILDVKKSFDLLCEVISKDKTIINKSDALSFVNGLRDYRPQDHKYRERTIKNLYNEL